MQQFTSIFLPLIAGIGGWFAANFIGKQMLDLSELRRSALRNAERYAFVSSHPSEVAIVTASKALVDSAVSLRTLSRTQYWLNTAYCRILRYDLELAAIGLLGLAQMAGEAVSESTRQNNLNLVYRSLNAYGHLSKADLAKLESALVEAGRS
jgi:hypothetical protein